MNSDIKNKPRSHKRFRIWSVVCLILGVYWLMTWYWGTTQVHQYYVELNREDLPPNA